MPRLATAAVLLCLLACSRDEPPARSVMLALAYPDSVRADGRLLHRSLIARGDSIFHGLAAGGTCFTCHGDNLRGGPVAPDLTDGDWHEIDGTYQSMVDIVTTGVPDHDPPMPPLGGAPLAAADVDAVAAYVYWRVDRHARLSAAAAGP